MKNIIKLGLTLALYAAVSCALLAVVNNWTSPKIEALKAAKTAEGLKIVLQDADSFQDVTADFPTKVGTTEINGVYAGYKNEEGCGVVIKATGATYDKSTILIGIDINGKCSGIVFLECSDSPGFGQKAADPNYVTSKGTTFYGQFTGLDFARSPRMGKDFEAISGATITSRGVETIIDDALSILK